MISVSEADDCYIAFVDYAFALPVSCLPKVTLVYQAFQWAVTDVEYLARLDAANIAAVDSLWNAFISTKKSDGLLLTLSDWSTAADALWTIAIQGSRGFDMKHVNAMQRYTEVIFTDPLSPL